MGIEMILDRDDFFKFHEIVLSMVGANSLFFAPLAVPVYISFVLILEVYRRAKLKDVCDCMEVKALNEIYQDIKKDLVSNMYELKIITVEDVYAYFYYLCTNGYLSYEHAHDNLGPKYYKESIILPKIFNKHGDDINYAYVLSDLLDTRGFKNAILEGKIINPTNKGKIKDNYDDLVSIPDAETLFKEEYQCFTEGVLDGLIWVDRYIKNVDKRIIVVRQNNSKIYLDPTDYQFFAETDEENLYTSSKRQVFIAQGNKSAKAIELEEGTIRDLYDSYKNGLKTLEYLEENKEVLDKMYEKFVPLLKEADYNYACLSKRI